MVLKYFDIAGSMAPKEAPDHHKGIRVEDIVRLTHSAGTPNLQFKR